MFPSLMDLCVLKVPGEAEMWREYTIPRATPEDFSAALLRDHLGTAEQRFIVLL